MVSVKSVSHGKVTLEFDCGRTKGFGVVQFVFFYSVSDCLHSYLLVIQQQLFYSCWE